MKVLYLVQDETAYARARARIAALDSADCLVLSIDEERPYFVDKFTDAEDVAAWQDVGIVRPRFGRYWLDEFETIDEAITAELRRLPRLDPDIVLSPHFRLRLASDLGLRYYEPIEVLFDLFEKLCPDRVCYRPSRGFLTELLDAVSAEFGVQREDLA